MRLFDYIKETKQPKLYFAHPRATYNTDIEKKTLDFLKKEFPNHKIINPNVDWIQGKVDTMGFDIFFKVIDTADIVVGMTFKDGKWGGGMHREGVHGQKKGKEVYQYNPYTKDFKKVDMKSIKSLTPEETFDRIPKKEQHKWKVHENEI